MNYCYIMFKPITTLKELDEIRAQNVIVTQQLKDKVQADTLGAQYTADQAAAQLQPITQLLQVTPPGKLKDKQGNAIVSIANLVNDIISNVAPSMESTQGKILATLVNFSNALIDGMTPLPPDSALARITYSLERIRALTEKGYAIAKEYGPEAVPEELEEEMDDEFEGLARMIKTGEISLPLTDIARSQLKLTHAGNPGYVTPSEPAGPEKDFMSIIANLNQYPGYKTPPEPAGPDSPRIPHASVETKEDAVLRKTMEDDADLRKMMEEHEEEVRLERRKNLPPQAPVREALLSDFQPYDAGKDSPQIPNQPTTGAPRAINSICNELRLKTK